MNSKRCLVAFIAVCVILVFFYKSSNLYVATETPSSLRGIQFQISNSVSRDIDMPSNKEDKTSSNENKSSNNVDRSSSNVDRSSTVPSQETGFIEIKLEPATSSDPPTPFHTIADNENLTIVTAYWDLGSFQKGSSQKFTRNTYITWVRSFAFMTNPLVVFTDSQTFLNIIKTHRAKFPQKTRIFFGNRKTLWPFQLIDQIRSVFSQPHYPKHHPNTVIPAYSAAQHTKYVVLAETVRKEYFKTPYYAWLDIGYFRDIAQSNNYFTLNPPGDFNSSRIAFNRVYNVKLNANPVNIFKGNQVWVGGGLALGTPNVILKFENMYHKAVLYFLDEKLMNTDQQVLYSLYSDMGRKELKPEVELQLFTPKGNGNPWFYLGYLCLKRLK